MNDEKHQILDLHFELDPESKMLNLNIINELNRINVLHDTEIVFRDVIMTYNLKQRGSHVIGIKKRIQNIPVCKIGPKTLVFNS